MKIFITWSGLLSLRLAKALRDWLPQVLTYVEPWVSAEDINKGTRWTPELWDNLKSSNFGILCLVPGIEQRPWVLFESGVLACAQAEDKVAPFLVGLEPSALPDPLRLFQCVRAERADVLQLLKSINDAGGQESISETDIDAAFAQYWPSFRERLRRLKIACSDTEEEQEPAVADGFPGDEARRDLDVLAAKVLVSLANSILPSESALGLALRVRRSERIVRLKLKDLEEWGLVEPVSRGFAAPEYRATEEGLRVLDRLGLVH